ncbi:hypothetical protein BUALT_Bualt17G0012300 [Buddleja alternifolia]|uniref:DUF659 domain-containing protein n=1 Tax=Buddleja alternifolia TaxID=168488 RepID=A0AAV6W5Z1_9LAMI|nr:hypothetical protein BUALT_Bualt17G0012300 [Buddleja alternifolia]
MGSKRVQSSSQSSSHYVSVDALNSMRQEGYEYDPKKRKVDGDNPIVKAFNNIGRKQLDVEIAKMFYSVSVTNVVQVITDNAPVCKVAGLLVEQAYPHIFWTPCVVHTLNLALKNICAAKNTDANEITYDECHWITEIATSAVMIKNFISNHSMRLAMFNEFSKLTLLAVAEMRFASIIIMLKRFKLIKQQLQAMVISERWSCYRDGDFNEARIVKERLLDDLWWDSVDYILAFMDPIYKILRECGTDKMLEDRWSKSNTPLHCLAYSLNPRCLSKVLQTQHPNFTPPQSDLEILKMRKLCLKRLFPDEDARRKIDNESNAVWTLHGPAAPNLQNIVVKLLAHVSSSSCSERNWSTYAFVHSTRRNQITPQRAQDLVFVHSNLRLLSRKTPQYMQDDTKMWDVGGDAFESSDDVGILEIANLSLDEPELENDIVCG